MKNFILIFACSIVTLSSFSQTNSVRKNQSKINFLVPSISHEFGVSKKASINAELGTGLLISGGTNQKTNLSLFPYLEGQYKYYYNFEKRAKKGKRTANNSANYISFLGNFQSGKAIIGNREYFEDYFLTIGPTWGIQRTYKGGFNLNLDLGVGYTFDNYNGGNVTPILKLTLGWVLNREK